MATKTAAPSSEASIPGRRGWHRQTFTCSACGHCRELNSRRWEELSKMATLSSKAPPSATRTMMMNSSDCPESGPDQITFGHCDTNLESRRRREFPGEEMTIIIAVQLFAPGSSGSSSFLSAPRFGSNVAKTRWEGVIPYNFGTPSK